MHSEKSERRTKDESPARHLVAGAGERAESPSTGAPGGQPLRLACAAWGLLGLCLLALPLRVGAAVPTGTDRTALEALYDDTVGDSWTTRTNWKTTDGDWHGVTTDTDGNVLELDLSRNKLTGTIPAEVWTLTQQLTQLFLNNNQLSGTIPAAAGDLKNLIHLYLHDNKLSGAIPMELGSLPEILHLDLHKNDLNGAIPKALGELANLTILRLDTNKLSGEIPEELGKLTQLTHLYLQANDLSGSIPELGDLTQLTTLWLHNNQLSGEIPAELGDLTALTNLRLYNNGRYRNAALSGPLPTSFSSLTALKELHAQNTYLTVPAALDNWAAGRAVTTGTAASSDTIALDAANTLPQGLWTNATTLYVSDPIATKVFAYRVADGSRDAAKDITLDPENTGAQGLWGNETTLWVADLLSHKLYAYTLATRSRDSANDIALEETNPRDLWSDGTTVWVVDHPRNVYAYTLETGSRDMTNDFGSKLHPANRAPRGLWSDGTTAWVVDPSDVRLYAYTLDGGSHDAAKYRVLDPANAAPWGVWSDGTTWYVADIDDLVVYVYRNQGPEAVGTLPNQRLAAGGSAQMVTVTHAFRDPDGDALTYSVESSNTAVVMASVTGAEVSVQPPAMLPVTTSAIVTVTATDADGSQMTATQRFAVRIERAEDLPPNRGPVAVGRLPDLLLQRLASGGSTQMVTVTHAFRDPDGDVLTYSVESSDTALATVSVTGAEVAVQPLVEGLVPITVGATDADGSQTTATQSFDVRIGPPPLPPPPPRRRPPPPPPGRGSGGGSGGGPSHDAHGNTPGQATPVTLDPAGMASTAGQLNTAPDVDYFTVDVPHAGTLVVTTTGSTDTVGTVWQDGEELAMADSGGARRNFRLSVRVQAGPVVIAVAGNGRQTGAYTLQVTLLPGFLENPGPNSFQSGIGVISGWTCEAEEVEIALNGTVQEAAYGTERVDTADICGDTDNGFGLLFNWNLLGAGEHTVVATVDGIELDRATVTVTTLGEEFVRGAEGSCTVSDFPLAGETAALVWQQSKQNFVLAAGAAPSGANQAGTPGVGYLENPSPNSFQSGIGVISGWVCAANEVVIAIGDLGSQGAGYGTERLDTQEVCEDTDNGFGLLFNWNLLGEGEHEVVAYVDGAELGRATVRVTTLGAEFLRGVEGECVVEDFPMLGETVTLGWQQNSQNFVITDVE